MSTASLRVHFSLRRHQFGLDVDLMLPGRGICALFGPSGSGKTTCLRVIAGLEPASAVYLEVNGEVWQDDAQGICWPTYRRPIGYVFQEASLFEHLDVAQNLAYGMRRIPPAQRRVSLEQAVALLDIGPLQQRRPATLSGGERQRVAIARALATSPQLLLMDEPLAALDAQRKAEIMPYLEQLHDTLDIPVLYVSHALDEVTRLADHLVLLESGTILASGPIATLLTRIDLDLAHGDSASAMLQGTLVAHDAAYHLSHVAFAGGMLLLPRQTASIGARVRVRIQARDVSLSLGLQHDTSILNSVAATITELTPDAPGQVMVGLDAGGARILARITHKSAVALQLQAGSRVFAHIKGVAILK